MDVDLPEVPVVSFRPVKRQKYLRKRVEESDDVPISETTVVQQRTTPEERHNNQTEGSQENEVGQDEVSRITRPRRNYRMRKGGIEFSTGGSQVADKNKDLRLAVEATDTDTLEAKFDRFTAHTGQKVDVDKHMYVFMLLYKSSRDIWD